MSEHHPEDTALQGAVDPVQRATTIFENWLELQKAGQAESFDELVGKHEDLRRSLERLRRMDAALRNVLERTAPEPIPEHVRSKMLGDYRILREVGRGAMGIVFEAEQVSLHRRVALKVLPAQLTLNDRALKRFQREAEIMARLNHRNIVGIHQVSEVAGVNFISMELVQGTSLDKIIERMRHESFDSLRRKRIGDVVSAHELDEGHAPATLMRSEPSSERPSSKKGSSSASNKNYIETAVKLVCHVADALEHAHEAGVVHRDVKPSNILVRSDGSPVLTDFGLAREDGLPSVSNTGDFAGTPNYVSPEQAMAGRMPVDHRADIFSLGATLYELLTLELAFPGESIQAVLTQIITKSPRDPGKLNSALAPDLVTIVLKALEKDSDRRYQSAAEFAADLRAFVEYRPIRAKRTPTVVRAWRWVKREPAKAGFFALLGIGVPLTAFLGRGWITTSSTLEARGPDLLEGDLKKVFLELGLGRYDQAETMMRTILESNESSPEAMTGLTLALLNQQRPADALALLARFESRHGTTGISRRLRTEALRVDGREAGADENEGSLGEPETALEEYVAGLLLLRGTTYERKTDVDTVLQGRERAQKAVELLHRSILTSSERASFYFALAWATYVARDESKARLVAQAIARKWPEQAMAWFHVGIAREVFDESAAREAFERAIELDPELSAAAERRAALLASRGEGKQAAEVFEDLVRQQPDDPKRHANLAAAQYEARDFAEAAATARRALELDPNLVAALDTLGSALHQVGDFEGAKEALTRAVELEPTGSRLHNDLGLTLSNLKDPVGAREHLELAHELDRNDPLYMYNLGKVLMESGEPEEAALLFEQAIEVNETHPNRDFPLDQAFGAKGYCHEQRSEYEQALAAYERAAKLAPKDPQHALLFGGMLHRAGRNEEAAEYLEQAIAGGRGNEQAFEALVLSFERLRRFGDALDASWRWTGVFPVCAKAWNYRAWYQVDPDGDEQLRDPEDGLLSAQEAVRLSGGTDPGILDTLAWALFQSGKKEQGIAEERRALDVALERGPVELIPVLEAQLERMESAFESARESESR